MVKWKSAPSSPVNHLFEVFFAFAQIGLNDYPGMRVPAEFGFFHKTSIKRKRQVLYPMVFHIKVYESAGLHRPAQDRAQTLL